MHYLIQTLALALLALFTTSQTFDRSPIGETREIRYSIGSTSELNITGTSNVTTFCCNSKQQFPPGKLSFTRVDDRRIKVSNAKLVIEAEGLDCGHKPITRDFKKTLKVEQHPNIIFALHEIALRHDVAAERSDWNWAVADTEITLAGCTNHKFLNVQYKLNPDGSFHLRGFARLCVSDFGLESPKPMLGLIKVEDEVDVEIFMDVVLEGQG